ncbi:MULTISPECIES: ABC transporter permease subunit [Fictibacillus]|jgi:peptide/nickel transport system permease protein|uniref:ABC transporter permease subunit n=1 Tax=Fictibacillus TaxID=1329200 RepID=UPI0018CC9648|nr:MULTISPECIES: ABC transporter permease subunit [unclassified Fictibacillus]MBH0158093.1 ABC transporter permease subunit [Fictibacillus sp. 5RED26]MBH0167082.1 ABC transporter permease subunit [Fictibacillus sp. 7GRE50]MBH0174821.1 ABC transporter permease subunit [Fictibacillus sp. 23RED33]
MNFSFTSYLKRLRSILIGVLIISFLPSIFFGIAPLQSMKLWEYTIENRKYSLFPDIFDKFFYSMTIFFTALLLGLLVALLLTFLATLLPRPLKRAVYGFLTLLESLPDLFIVIALQVSAVYIFKKTGLLIANVSGVYDNRIYFFPILTLSVLPTIQLFKITFLLMKEEQNKPYITVARAMGLGNLYITLNHVFRNIMTSLFQYSKTIFVFMLSNLFILEYVFNLNGIMTIMLNTQGVSFIITVLFIAIPFSFLFEVMESYRGGLNVQKEDAA